MSLQFAANLPLVQFGERSIGAERILATATSAARLGFWGLAANDHVIFSRPWLDGPTALALAIPHSGDMRLCTTVALPTIRGPLQLGKTLIALDELSDGRVLAGIGPGSSARDYLAAGVPFEERWPRFDDSARVLRELLSGDRPADGTYYAPAEVADELQPRPRQPVPIWIGSWGSTAGLRRVARLADGWLASAYNTTPDDFGAARATLAQELPAHGKDPARFPNALATMWLWITESAAEAERVLADVLGPAVKRDPDYLRTRVCVGGVQHCLDLLARYEGAGLERVILWPLGEEERQLELVAEELMPVLSA